MLTHRRTILDPQKLEYLNKLHLMETWSQPDGLNGLANRAIGSIEEAFPNRCVLRPSHIGSPTLMTHTSKYATVDHTKQVILALQVWYHLELFEGPFNTPNRVGSPTSFKFRNSPLTSSSSLIIDRKRRNLWSSPYLRLISVPFNLHG